MSKEDFNKIIGLIILLVFITLIKRWFDYSYAIVWLGAIVGYYLPFIDHLFYAFIVRPDQEVSRNIRSLFSVRKAKQLVAYVKETQTQRDRLIIHTAYFQAVFMLLTFYILSSSGSLFGRGLVYGFSLRLLIEQLFEFMEFQSIGRWFTGLPIQMDLHRTKVFLYANGFLLFIFSMML